MIVRWDSNVKMIGANELSIRRKLQITHAAEEYSSSGVLLVSGHHAIVKSCNCYPVTIERAHKIGVAS